jgi:hypothetical protein
LKRSIAFAAEWAAKDMTPLATRKLILIFPMLCLRTERHTVEWQALVWQANILHVFLALSLLDGSNLGGNDEYLHKVSSNRRSTDRQCGRMGGIWTHTAAM